MVLHHWYSMRAIKDWDDHKDFYDGFHAADADDDDDDAADDDDDYAADRGVV